MSCSPRINGLDVLARIRQTSTVRAILLTTREEEIDKVLGLSAGDNDYLTKPLGGRGFLARVRAVVRRNRVRHHGKPFRDRCGRPDRRSPPRFGHERGTGADLLGARVDGTLGVEAWTIGPFGVRLRSYGAGSEDHPVGGELERVRPVRSTYVHSPSQVGWRGRWAMIVAGRLAKVCGRESAVSALSFTAGAASAGVVKATAGAAPSILTPLQDEGALSEALLSSPKMELCG